MGERLLLLTRLEASRLTGRKAVKAVLLLPLVVIAVSAAIRGGVRPYMEAARHMGFSTSRLWLAPLGVLSVLNQQAAANAPQLAGLSLVSVASYAWAVAILFGVFSMASDVGGGRLALLASRPVPRSSIVASKTLASFILLSLLYTVTAAASYASGWLLAGHQADAWLIPLYGVSEAAASLPLLLLTFLYSLKLKRTGSTFAAALVTYFVLSLVPLLVEIPSIAHGSFTMGRAFVYAEVAEPIHSMSLGRLVLEAAVEGIHGSYSVAGASIQGVTVGSVLAVASASVAAAVAALYAGLRRYFARYDVPG